MHAMLIDGYDPMPPRWANVDELATALCCTCSSAFANHFSLYPLTATLSIVLSDRLLKNPGALAHMVASL